MNQIKNRLIQNLGITFYLFVFNVAKAIGADDPFESATKKADELTKYLSGDFAIAVCTVIIVVAAIALMFNKLRMEWALRIIGGAIIIASGAAIADWAFDT
ncbi:TrbC/VirB2 family protein [Desulfospira joergensenii]|uniref:TrbC/VirB2 family protein n=1 Tax=Desulfospira joergensenii TaxID=53329 RepID=UPI0003B5F1C1|nr:TrbC/VirB2 family protein [Desulfospira joergensenii]